MNHCGRLENVHELGLQAWVSPAGTGFVLFIYLFLYILTSIKPCQPEKKARKGRRLKTFIIEMTCLLAPMTKSALIHLFSRLFPDLINSNKDLSHC